MSKKQKTENTENTENYVWVSPDNLEYKVKITEHSGEYGDVLYGNFYKMKPPIKYFHYPYFRFGEDVKTLGHFKNVYITRKKKYPESADKGGIFKELRTTSGWRRSLDPPPPSSPTRTATIGGRRRGSTRGRSRYQKATKRVHKTRSKRD
jgi:hypothetical protein